MFRMFIKVGSGLIIVDFLAVSIDAANMLRLKELVCVIQIIPLEINFCYQHVIYSQREGTPTLQILTGNINIAATKISTTNSSLYIIVTDKIPIGGLFLTISM